MCISSICGFLRCIALRLALTCSHGNRTDIHRQCVALQATQRAHRSLRGGRLSLAAGELLDANTNRSPTAYLVSLTISLLGLWYNNDEEAAYSLAHWPGKKFETLG